MCFVVVFFQIDYIALFFWWQFSFNTSLILCGFLGVYWEENHCEKELSISWGDHSASLAEFWRFSLPVKFDDTRSDKVFEILIAFRFLEFVEINGRFSPSIWIKPWATWSEFTSSEQQVRLSVLKLSFSRSLSVITVFHMFKNSSFPNLKNFNIFQWITFSGNSKILIIECAQAILIWYTANSWAEKRKKRWNSWFTFHLDNLF